LQEENIGQLTPELFKPLRLALYGLHLHCFHQDSVGTAVVDGFDCSAEAAVVVAVWAG